MKVLCHDSTGVWSEKYTLKLCFANVCDSVCPIVNVLCKVICAPTVSCDLGETVGRVESQRVCCEIQDGPCVFISPIDHMNVCGKGGESKGVL